MRNPGIWIAIALTAAATAAPARAQQVPPAVVPRAGVNPVIVGAPWTKLAVTDRSAVIVQTPPPVQPVPLKPDSVHPVVGIAESVTWVPCV